MTSPTIQLEPGKSISFEKLKRILEKVEELKKQYKVYERTTSWGTSELWERVKELLEVYEDE